MHRNSHFKKKRELVNRAEYIYTPLRGFTNLFLLSEKVAPECPPIGTRVGTDGPGTGLGASVAEG